jgi:hypothetical protein
MKKFIIFLIIFILILGIITIILNKVEYNYPDKTTLHKQINYLDRVISEPLDYKSELFHVQDQSGEWMLFSLSFSVYGLTNVSFQDSLLKPQAVRIIGEAISKTMTEEVYKYYTVKNMGPLHPVDSEFSVLYLGHLNLMMGCYRLLTNDGKYDELNDSISKSLFTRFRNSKTICLESYEHSIWIPDNTVALASLKLNGEKNNIGEYEKLCREWVRYARKNFTDKNTNVLCATIDYRTGKITEEPRGSMLGWSIFFIYRFDMLYAEELYENYKKFFSDDILMFKMFKEWKGTFTTGEGDIDSGPLVLGYGIPASAWAFGNAILFGDLKDAKKLDRLINLGSKVVETDDEIKYKIRFVDRSVSPLNEALMLYLQTMRDWKKK